MISILDENLMVWVNDDTFWDIFSFLNSVKFGLKISFSISVECSVTEFQCKDQKKCVDIRRRCDAYPDCLDRSDERDCQDGKQILLSIYDKNFCWNQNRIFVYYNQLFFSLYCKHTVREHPHMTSDFWPTYLP